MNQSGIIFEHFTPSGEVTIFSNREKRKKKPAKQKGQAGALSRLLGVALIAFSLGGLLGPLTSTLRLEAGYQARKATTAVQKEIHDVPVLPPSVPVIYDPLVTPEGSSIAPISQEFSIIVPKIGINAEVIPAVNPLEESEYLDALEQGVAHSSLSYFPDEDGTVYIFSHSTNYDWFVKDLNAVFYHLKNLEAGDDIVLVFERKRYTYQLRKKEVVDPSDISYLTPQTGHKGLILQTCWPPGSTTERLLLFADLVEQI